MVIRTSAGRRRRRSDSRNEATEPLSALRWIEWDEYPFDPPDQLNEIDFLRQFIGNLSVDEIEAGVEAMIGVEGMHRNGEWIKAAILRMIPG